MTLCASSVSRAATRSSPAGGSSSPRRVNPTRSANATVTSRPAARPPRAVCSAAAIAASRTASRKWTRRPFASSSSISGWNAVDLRREALRERRLVEVRVVRQLEDDLAELVGDLAQRVPQHAGRLEHLLRGDPGVGRRLRQPADREVGLAQRGRVRIGHRHAVRAPHVEHETEVQARGRRALARREAGGPAELQQRRQRRQRPVRRRGAQLVHLEPVGDQPLEQRDPPGTPFRRHAVEQSFAFPVGFGGCHGRTLCADAYPARA